MTSMGTLVGALAHVGEALERGHDVLAAADVRPERADRSARFGQMRARQIHRGLDARRHRRRQAAGLALSALELHENGGEPLREVVVDVAGEAVALLEDRLAPLFEPIELHHPAVMQRESRLPGDGFDQHHAPPLAVGLGRAFVATVIHPSVPAPRSSGVEMIDPQPARWLNSGSARLAMAKLFEDAGHKFEKMGINVGKPKLDLAAMMKFKDEGVDGNVKGVDFLLKKNKVDTYRGTGRITAPGKVEVKSADGDPDAGHEEHRHRDRLRRGAAERHRDRRETDRVVDRRDRARQVPERLLVIGAGVIGLELGSVWRRLGSEVTVVEFLDRILPGMDGEMARAVPALFEKQGMNSSCVEVTGVEAPASRLSRGRTGRGRRGGDDRSRCGAGRGWTAPYTEGLGLDKAGVKMDKRGRIVVDAHFETNVPGIYAIGDVIAGPMLAHKAEDEGVAVAEIMAGQAGHVNYDVIPSVIYTYPEIATVGKTEEELKAGGRRLQGRQVSLHRQRPAKVNLHHRRFCEDPRRRQDRPRTGRPHHRGRRRQHDRRSRARDGIRRCSRRHRAHLPRASDADRGGEGSGAWRSPSGDPHLRVTGLTRQSISRKRFFDGPAGQARG